MLVITRKAGESVCLGDDVTITVLDIVGSAVRIGIAAPAEIPVYRQEIWDAVKAENQAAAQASITKLPSTLKQSQDEA
ncbi:MAG: carbon storage regulator CsrA [Gaiella sp.]